MLSTYQSCELVSVKKRLQGRKYTIRIQESPEGGYTGQCLELPGAISEGETLAELKSYMTEAIKLVLDGLEMMSKKDKKIVIEVPN